MSLGNKPRKCPTCALYNQTPLPTRRNPKSTQIKFDKCMCFILQSLENENIYTIP